MRYEGTDVNKLISNGLLGGQSALDKNKPADAPVAAPAARPALLKEGALAPASQPSVITHCVKLTGAIETVEELHIYGTVTGNVRASSVVIFKGGMVNGEVVADAVIVHGAVEGSIQGKKVQLASSAIVRGDIFHDVIGIDPGAQFEGASKRMPAPAANDITSISEAA
jgi:cytoskeletal protein CcmA (bactofilin family)